MDEEIYETEQARWCTGGEYEELGQHERKSMAARAGEVQRAEVMV